MPGHQVAMIFAIIIFGILMSKVAAALALATRLKRLKCGHEKPVSASDCICNLVGLCLYACIWCITLRLDWILWLPSLASHSCFTRRHHQKTQDWIVNVWKICILLHGHTRALTIRSAEQKQIFCGQQGPRITGTFGRSNILALNWSQCCGCTRSVSARCRVCPWCTWTERCWCWRKLPTRPGISSKRCSSTTVHIILSCAHFFTLLWMERDTFRCHPLLPPWIQLLL